MWNYILGIFAALPLLRGLMNGPFCKIKRDLSQKVIIITGANTGIGKETARSLAAMGATIVLACRSKERTQEVFQELQDKYGKEKIYFICLDLSDLQSVHNFVAEFKRLFTKLDILINNAGLILSKRQVTPQGLECTFATNYLGHFALTLALKPLLLKSSEARIINLASKMHRPHFIFGRLGKIFWHDLNFERESYQSMVAYSQSKLAVILFTKYFQNYLDSETTANGLPPVKCVSLIPGVVATEFVRQAEYHNYGRLKYLFLKDPNSGAQPTLQCCLQDFSTLESGGYYGQCILQKSSDTSNDPREAQRLWRVSLEILRQKGFGDLVEGY